MYVYYNIMKTEVNIDKLVKLYSPILVMIKKDKENGRKCGKKQGISNKYCLWYILVVLKSGIPWSDLRYHKLKCHYLTIQKRYYKWVKKGFFSTFHSFLQLRYIFYINNIDPQIMFFIDSTDIRNNCGTSEFIGFGQKFKNKRAIKLGELLVADSTLTAIQKKVRRLTRSITESNLSTAQLNEYINTFVLYDFPEHLRLFNLRTTFEFFTEPFIDVYETSTNINSPLYNFKNKYITVHPPIYIAGFQAVFSESREQFFSVYPLFNSIASIGTTGDGIETQFAGVINSQQANVPPTVNQNICLLRNNVLFSSVDLNNNGLAMIDYPISSSIGNLYVPGGAPTSTTVQDAYNAIDYTTGQFIVTFATAAGAGEPINSQTVPSLTALPQSLLFFDGKFTVRPVPDQPYRVKMEVYARPTELLATDQSPELQEWWQYIAYGAAKKVFEDRMDTDSIQAIFPEFKKQELLIQRRTIVQQTSQRTSTIYTDVNVGAGAYSGWQSN